MYQWGKHLDIKHVKMLPDGNGEFTQGMGMLVKKDNVGFGGRSWRYSMVVSDKKIIKVFAEPGQMDNCPDDPYTVSSADTVLDYLKMSSK
jgi:peroxiredoxin